MTPIATHMYQGLPFKIYRNIKCDTGLGDARHSNYGISVAGDPTGRCKGKEGRSCPGSGADKIPLVLFISGASGVFFPGRLTDAS